VTDPLQSAIKGALAQQVQASPPVELPSLADAACGAIEAAMEAASELRFGPRTARLGTALTLLRSSADHGRALLSLLRDNHVDFATSALVLHRSQVEQFLRAVFIGFQATDDEISFFLRKDELPKRKRRPQDKPERLTVRDLATLAGPALDVSPDKLISMVATGWGHLSGLSHGGTTLLGMYGALDAPIGSDVARETLVQIITNATAIGNMSFAAAAKLSATPDDELPDMIKSMNSAWVKFNELRQRA
jgi:hypothetical protein